MQIVCQTNMQLLKEKVVQGYNHLIQFYKSEFQFSL